MISFSPSYFATVLINSVTGALFFSTSPSKQSFNDQLAPLSKGIISAIACAVSLSNPHPLQAVSVQLFVPSVLSVKVFNTLS